MLPLNDAGKFLNHLYTNFCSVTICCKSVILVSLVIIVGNANTLHNSQLRLLVICQL
ncbi:MAG: hypothetical protein Q8M44_07385 [bacterium]|nr:hypothetical protein [bacterium]